MKNWLKGLAIGAFVLVLSACNDTADVKPGTDKGNESDLTVQEVFDKAQAASEKIESMHASMDIVQNIKVPEADLDMNNKIKVEMDMILDPVAMHQEIEVEAGEEGTMKTELYMVDEGVFMEDSTTATWMKLPEELFEELSASLTSGADPTVDFASLQEFVEDFKFEQNDDAYILKLKASGDKFKEFIQSELESAGMAYSLGIGGAEILDSMAVHQFDYEIFVDKKTFETTAFNMVMDMEISEEGESVRIVQDVKSIVSQINEVKEISVPQDILDSAKSL